MACARVGWPRCSRGTTPWAGRGHITVHSNPRAITQRTPQHDPHWPEKSPRSPKGLAHQVHQAKTKPLRSRFYNNQLQCRLSAIDLPCAIHHGKSPQVAIFPVRTFFTSSRLRREAAPPGAAGAVVRVEVRDLRRRLVAAGWCSWGQPDPGGAGEGGSSPDKAGTCQYCQMGRSGERGGKEYERNRCCYVLDVDTGSNLADLGRARRCLRERRQPKTGYGLEQLVLNDQFGLPEAKVRG